MDVQLPATAEVKLVRQALPQKIRGFIWVLQDLGGGWTAVSKTISSSGQACSSYKDREERAFLLSDNLVSFQWARGSIHSYF